MATVEFWKGMEKASDVAGSDKMMFGEDSSGEVKYVDFNQVKDYLTITGQSLDPIASGALPTPAAGQVRTMEVVGPDAAPDGSPATSTWTHATLPGGSASLDTGKRGTFFFNGSVWALRNVRDLPKGEDGKDGKDANLEDWDNTKTYTGQQFVLYNGSFYELIAGQTATGVDVPDVATTKWTTKIDTAKLDQFSGINSNLFVDLYQKGSVWFERAKGIESIKVFPANPADVWYVAIIRNLASANATSFGLTKKGSNGGILFQITKAEVTASTSKIVTKRSTMSDGTVIEATVDFNKVTVDWNNSVYDDPAQMGLTVSNRVYQDKPEDTFTSSSTEKPAAANRVRVLNDYNNLSANLFRNLNAQTDAFKSRAKGILDIKIFSAVANDLWYVAIMRPLGASQSTRFRIVRFGTNGAYGVNITADEVTASGTNVVTKRQVTSDGTVVELTVDFNLITDSWNNSVYDDPAQMGLTVSKSRMFLPTLSSTDLINDFSGGTTKPASAEETKVLKIASDSYKAKLGSPLKYLWKNDFANAAWIKTNWAVSGSEVVTTTAGSANALNLNKQYSLEKRHDRLTFKMTADAILCIQYKDKENNPTRVNLEVNIFGSGIFNIGDKTGTGVKRPDSADTPFLFNADHFFTIDITRNAEKITLILTNMTTAQAWSYTYAAVGYDRLMNRDAFNVFMISGTSITVGKYEMTCRRPYLVIRGDSNTEGVQLLTPQKRWADMVIDALPSARFATVAGRLSGTITGLQEASNNEDLILYPEYDMITIGTNGGNTVANLTALCQGLINAGIQPILNTVVCRSNNAHIAINNNILTVVATLGLPCARLDIATALNNDPAQGYNPAIYRSDGVHIAAEGQEVLFNRIKADLPFLFE